MLQTLHDLQFLEDISHFIALNTLLFVHVFHCVHLLGIILLNDADLLGQTRVRKWWGGWRIIVMSVMSDWTRCFPQQGVEVLSLAHSLMPKLPLSSDFRVKRLPFSSHVQDQFLSRCFFKQICPFLLWRLFKNSVLEKITASLSGNFP